MLAGGDHCFQMLGMIIRRCRDHHRIHFSGICDLLIGFRPLEDLRRGDLRVAFGLLHVVEMFAGRVESILKHVG